MSHKKLFWGIIVGAVSGLIVGATLGKSVPLFHFLGTLFS